MNDKERAIEDFITLAANINWLEAKSADCKWLCENFGVTLPAGADVVLLSEKGCLLFAGSRAGAGKLSLQLNQRAKSAGKKVEEVKFRTYKHI